MTPHHLNGAAVIGHPSPNRPAGSTRRGLSLWPAVLVIACSAGASRSADPAPTGLPAAQVRALVQRLKLDPRGPFQGIRWFCPDGSVRPANTPCGEPGGRQNGLHRDDVQALARDHHLYLGQVLTGAQFEAFLDSSHQYSRAKQFQVEQYLKAIDDGWIMRGGRYYRGALQIEGEEAWSRDFLAWLVSQDDLLRTHFLLCRQLSRALPYRTGSDESSTIRNLAASIAAAHPAFADLKNKIHSQPEASDSLRVAEFRRRGAAPSAAADSMLGDLENRLGAAYRRVDAAGLRTHLAALPARSPITAALSELLSPAPTNPRSQAVLAAEVIWQLRGEILAAPAPQRLALLSLSADLEDFLYRLAPSWKAQTVGELFEKSYVLGRAAAGAGYLEIWEWQTIEAALAPFAMRRTVSPQAFLDKVDQTRRAVAWGAASAMAAYGATSTTFASFEPLAAGFVDDMVRGSILLPWGEVAADLAELGARKAGLTNEILNLRGGGANGLNPGYALGELVVISGTAADVAFSDRKIYIIERPPADLKPVAGIATVTEGNTVSHVQLLARNLGIPNAVMSSDLLVALKPYAGRSVFYAVSPRGRVILRLAEDMTDAERDLFAVRQRSEERIAVPTDRLELDRVELFRLRNLRASDSGRLCGPKAANLGQLHAMFPGMVAPGLVIPFGVFREHFDQPMPGTEGSYWQFLQGVFAEAARARRQGLAEEDVERAILAGLDRLRETARLMPFLPEFMADLRHHFEQAFGGPLGQVPVFVRSDTNMEDLKDFTGAGLNLTVPNALAEEVILQGIRDVWASPFTERSYRWRQRYLLNPENVYPSILLLQTVDVDKSGVMVTAGLASQNPDDLTVAFSRGVGGAVDGQAAETWLLRRASGEVLLSPAREPRYTVLPATGGVARQAASFEEPILTAVERAQLRYLGEQIRQRLPSMPGVDSRGPFDVELGFLEGKPWLFQARPFVESKRAQSSIYLRGLDPVAPPSTWVVLEERLR